MVFINLMWLVKGNSNLALVTPNVIFVYFIRSIVDDIYLHIFFLHMLSSVIRKEEQANKRRHMRGLCSSFSNSYDLSPRR